MSLSRHMQLLILNRQWTLFCFVCHFCIAEYLNSHIVYLQIRDTHIYFFIYMSKCIYYIVGYYYSVCASGCSWAGVYICTYVCVCEWVCVWLCVIVLYFFVTCSSLYPNSEPKLHRGWTQALTHSLHATASLGIGERVPLQPLSDSQTEGGDRPYTMPIRTTD